MKNFLIVALFLALVVPATAGATVLSDNLGAGQSGTEIVTSTRWVTASFATDASSQSLSSVVILMDMTSAGTALASIYTNAGSGVGAPGSLIGNLTSPAAYTTSMGVNTFTASGISLAANTAYWVVLAANSGSFDWAWTSDNTGSGVGPFQHTWGYSDDSGATWNTYALSPQQMAGERRRRTCAGNPSALWPGSRRAGGHQEKVQEVTAVRQT